MPRPPARQPRRFKPKSRKPMARRPKAGKRKYKSASKESIRQQNLGQQTRQTCLLNAGRPDTRAKIMKAVGTTCNYITNGKGAITTEGINGRQAWDDSVMANTDDMNAISVQLAGRSGVLSAKPPARFLLENIKHRVQFTNASQANVKLAIYHCTARRDIYGTNTYTSPNGTTYGWSGYSLANVVQQGVAAAVSGPTSGSSSHFIPGVLPYESQIFNQYFKVHKESEIMLAIGGTHTLETNKRVDRVLDATHYANSEKVAMLGITEYLLFRIEGQAGLTDVGGVVTVTPSQVIYTETWDYSFCQLESAVKFMFANDNIEANDAQVNVISGSTGGIVPAEGLLSPE